MHSTELNMSSVGERLKSIRGNLSQTGFAKELDIDRQSVSRYESGERTIDANVIFKLMTKFNIDANWLLTGEGTAPDLNADERELLVMYRAAPLAIKAAALGALTAGTAQISTKQIVHGNNSGVMISDTNLGNITFHNNSERKRK